MLGDRLAHDVSQALVTSLCRAVDVVSRLSKLWIVPELVAGTPVLLNADVLKSNHVLLVGHFVHLGMNKQLVCITHDRQALIAGEL